LIIINYPIEYYSDSCFPFKSSILIDYHSSDYSDSTSFHPFIGYYPYLIRSHSFSYHSFRNYPYSYPIPYSYPTPYSCHSFSYHSFIDYPYSYHSFKSYSYPYSYHSFRNYSYPYSYHSFRNYSFRNYPFVDCPSISYPYSYYLYYLFVDCLHYLSINCLHHSFDFY